MTLHKEREHLPLDVFWVVEGSNKQWTLTQETTLDESES